jgi:magnesium-transporting ATPase (P-type)
MTRTPTPWCGAGWTYSGGSLVSPRATGGARETVTVLHRYHFSSALKRMAALVRVRRWLGLLGIRPLPRACRMDCGRRSRACVGSGTGLG